MLEKIIERRCFRNTSFYNRCVKLKLKYEVRTTLLEIFENSNIWYCLIFKLKKKLEKSTKILRTTTKIA